MDVVRGTAFEACADTGISGLVGTITLMLIDNQGVTIWAPDATGIIEEPAGSGVYCATRTAPLMTGQDTLIWSTDGTYSPQSVAVEDLFVVASLAVPPSPLPPIPAGDGMQVGPFNAWTTSDEVAACCNVELGSDVAVFDEVVDKASQVLFELSGRQFLGEGEKTVRPCRTNCGCNWQVLSRGHIVGPWDWGGNYSWNCDGEDCGCFPMSRVKLSGYPVRDISEVKIDGDVLAPTEYRLDKHRYVTRMNSARWPGCQNLTLEDTEDGTWSITYTFGMDPPLAGRNAAQQLACELYKSCAGQECSLPTGATRVTRQGITIERQFFRRDPITKAWRTGLSMVDLFLNAYNPNGIPRKTIFWAPSTTHRYAPELG